MVNGDGQRWQRRSMVAVNDGQRWRSSPDHRSTVVDRQSTAGSGQVVGWVWSGRGPGQVGSWAGSGSGRPRVSCHVSRWDLLADVSSDVASHVALTTYHDAAIRNQGASIKTLEIQIGQMSKFDEKKGSYRPQFLESYSEASHIDNSIHRKEKDPGSFTLPYFINSVCFDNALVNLGASVSVMPLLTYLNLGLGELAHTNLIVELADRTVKYPKGIAENVLVGIGKFVFPVDFIILDMPEDIKVSLILGRPFLSIAHAKIDVFKRKITLRIGEERIIFKSVKPA
ncbi:hypothetical protein Tco_1526512, partial [Tanacetum coccineum]